jgi:hypothetical protein
MRFLRKADAPSGAPQNYGQSAGSALAAGAAAVPLLQPAPVSTLDSAPGVPKATFALPVGPTPESLRESEFPHIPR